MIIKMKNTSLLVIATLYLFLPAFANQCDAGVNVNIGDDGVNVTVGGDGVNVSVRNRLPAHRFAAPPDLAVIPGTYVYLVPDIDVEVLFFQGYWWRPSEGYWYRSSDYNGEWIYVESERIPNGLRSLPQDYRHRLSHGYERIPHRDVERNWEKWEKEKYWDKRSEQGRGGHEENRHDDRKGNDDH